MDKNKIVKVRYQFSIGDRDEVWSIKADGSVSVCKYKENSAEMVEDFYNVDDIGKMFSHILKCIENSKDRLEREDGNVAIFYKDGSILKICSSLDDGNESIRDIIESHILNAA